MTSLLIMCGAAGRSRELSGRAVVVRAAVSLNRGPCTHPPMIRGTLIKKPFLGLDFGQPGETAMMNQHRFLKQYQHLIFLPYA